MMRRIVLSAAMILVVAWASGCASAKTRASVAAPEAMDEAALRSQYQAEVEQIARKDMAAIGQDADVSQARLVRRRPYYLKECAAYPAPGGPLEITLRETESRTRPYLAELIVPKVRFSSRLHRKKDNAREDNRIFRDTGQETVTYELRSGVWKRIGGVFVAEKTEEYINGEWLPRQEEVKRIVPAEEPEGWFRTKWQRLFGRE